MLQTLLLNNKDSRDYRYGRINYVLEWSQLSRWTESRDLWNWLPTEILKLQDENSLVERCKVPRSLYVLYCLNMLTSFRVGKIYKSLYLTLDYLLDSSRGKANLRSYSLSRELQSIYLWHLANSWPCENHSFYLIFVLCFFQSRIN
jgi:hypothetical protein